MKTYPYTDIFNNNAYDSLKLFNKDLGNLN